MGAHHDAFVLNVLLVLAGSGFFWSRPSTSRAMQWDGQRWLARTYINYINLLNSGLVSDADANENCKALLFDD